MTPIKAVAFDKDGTLFDFAATWEAWATSFLIRLADGDSETAAAMGAAVGFDTDRSAFQPDSLVIAGTPFEVADALAPLTPHIPLDRLLHVLNEEASRAPQAEVVPLKTFTQSLRNMGLRLGVVTNDAESPALAHLDAAGVRDAFEFIAGSDSGYGAKPAPGQLLAFAKAVSTAPESCVMVGDSLHDLMAGRAAGMRTVGVLTGYATKETLTPHADTVLSDISELPDWLSRQ